MTERLAVGVVPGADAQSLTVFAAPTSHLRESPTDHVSTAMAANQNAGEYKRCPALWCGAFPVAEQFALHSFERLAVDDRVMSVRPANPLLGWVATDLLGLRYGFHLAVKNPEE